VTGPFIAAFLVGVVAPFARATAWGAPVAYFSLAMVLRAGAGAALVTLAAGLIATMVTSDMMSGIVGICVGLPLMLLSARRMRYVRGATLLAMRLKDPVVHERAFELLQKRLDAAKRALTPASYAQLMLLISAPVVSVGKREPMAARLRAVPLEPLPSSMRAQVLHARSTLDLQIGDYEHAQEALDDLPDDTPEELTRWTQVTQALLWALQGNADDALDYVERAPSDEELLPALDLIQAHAYASMSRDEEAKAALGRLKDRGPHALESALKPVGPATDLARALLT